MSINLVIDDIAACDADVVVVSAARHILTVSGGALKSAWLAASDWEIEEELRDRYGYDKSTALRPGELTVVGGYNLCKHLLLVQAPRKRDGACIADLEDAYRQAFLKALELMEDCADTVRIACSLMSTGRAGMFTREEAYKAADEAAESLSASLSGKAAEITAYSDKPVAGVRKTSSARSVREELSWDSDTALKDFVIQLFDRRLTSDPGVRSDRDIAETIEYGSSTLSKLKSGNVSGHHLDKACKLACLCESAEEIKRLLSLCGLKPRVIKQAIDSGIDDILAQDGLGARVGLAKDVTARVRKASR